MRLTPTGQAARGTYLTTRELAAELAEPMTAARLDRPYESAVLLALRPVCAPGLGTVAVRPDGVLLVDVDWWRGRSLMERAALLLHEAEHLLFDHAHRLPAYLEACGYAAGVRGPTGGTLDNAAADLEINCGHRRASTLGSQGKPALPTDGLFPDTVSALVPELRANPLPDTGTAEQYAARLIEAMQSGPGGDGDELNDDSQDEGDESGPGPGPELDQEKSSEPTKGGKTDGRPGTSGNPKGGKSTGRVPVECGSGATGNETEAEAQAVAEARERGDYPDTSERDELAMQDKRDEVAEAVRIAARSKTRGSLPAHLVRWAEDRRDRPVVPWQRLLRNAVRGALSTRVTGRQGRTYSRGNRRNVATSSGASSVTLPGWHGVTPKVAIVIDTSGSMSDGLLSRCLSELDAALAAFADLTLDVVACDTKTTTTRNVRKAARLKRDKRLRGGGGTDLRVGIREAEELKPHAIVVLTDGYTPWPHERPSVKGGVVVGILDPSNAEEARRLSPSWATTVVMRTVPEASDNP